MLQQLLELQEQTSAEGEAVRKMLLATLLLELKDLCKQQQAQGGESGRVSNHIVEQIQTYIAEHYSGKTDPDRALPASLHQPVLPEPAV